MRSSVVYSLSCQHQYSGDLPYSFANLLSPCSRASTSRPSVTTFDAVSPLQEHSLSLPLLRYAFDDENSRRIQCGLWSCRDCPQPSADRSCFLCIGLSGRLPFLKLIIRAAFLEVVTSRSFWIPDHRQYSSTAPSTSLVDVFEVG